MPSEQSLLKNWSTPEFNTLEEGVLAASHGLADTGFFTDESLATLLDNQPDDALTISTMGSDPTRFEWIEGDRNGVTGETLMTLVQQGRLWLNARSVLNYHPHIAEAVDSIYDELQARSPGFKAQDRTANLLISSSTAMVHYHIDMPVNMLWHIRGQKRVWVYPHFDHRFVSQEVVEKVCAGELSEDVPYDPEFDKYALVFDVEPGQLLTWPQFTPHRVQNLGGVCVSLSTEHKNPRARRRINVNEANYFLRHNLGRFYHHDTVDGVGAQLKQAMARAVRLGRKLFGNGKEQFVYSKQFTVDPTAPDGILMAEDSVNQTAPHELINAS